MKQNYDYGLFSFLGHGCSPQILAWSFKIGISTVREIVYETCQVIYSQLHSIYLSPPNRQEYKEIAAEFWRKCKVPNCIGAIDGKHIRIFCPRNSGSIYIIITRSIKYFIITL